MRYNRNEPVPTRNLTKEKEERERRNAERAAAWEAERLAREEEEQDEDLVDLDELNNADCMPSRYYDCDIPSPISAEVYGARAALTNDNDGFAELCQALEQSGEVAGKHFNDYCKVDVDVAEAHKADKELTDKAIVDVQRAAAIKQRQDDFDTAFPNIAKARKERELKEREKQENGMR